MSNPLSQFSVNGLTVKILADHDAPMPEPCGVFISYAKDSRFTLGNSPLSTDEQAKLSARIERGEIWALPVWALVHSNTTLSLSPFGSLFDSGRSGWVWMEKQEGLTVRSAIAIFRSAIEEFNAWLNAGFVGYQILSEGGIVLDSCWGFYPADYCREEATKVAEELAQTAFDAAI